MNKMIATATTRITDAIRGGDVHISMPYEAGSDFAQRGKKMIVESLCTEAIQSTFGRTHEFGLPLRPERCRSLQCVATDRRCCGSRRQPFRSSAVVRRRS